MLGVDDVLSADFLAEFELAVVEVDRNDVGADCGGYMNCGKPEQNIRSNID
jgi:hypothetical protein